MIVELILEDQRKGNAAEICRRENIQPNLLYRWRQRFAEDGAVRIVDRVAVAEKSVSSD